MSTGGAEQYEWKKDGEVITGPKYSGSDGPTLTVNKFSVADQGKYLCVIRNSQQSIESNPANMALGNHKCK